MRYIVEARQEWGRQVFKILDMQAAAKDDVSRTVARTYVYEDARMVAEALNKVDARP